MEQDRPMIADWHLSPWKSFGDTLSRNWLRVFGDDETGHEHGRIAAWIRLSGDRPGIEIWAKPADDWVPPMDPEDDGPVEYWPMKKMTPETVGLRPLFDPSGWTFLRDRAERMLAKLTGEPPVLSLWKTGF